MRNDEGGVLRGSEVLLNRRKRLSFGFSFSSFLTTLNPNILNNRSKIKFWINDMLGSSESRMKLNNAYPVQLTSCRTARAGVVF